MAMVKARKGEHYIKVSRQAYDALFRNKGFVLVGEEEEKGSENNEIGFDDSENDGSDESEAGNEVETIPVSEMNKEQLAEYAKEHGIDTSGARNVREARQIIQKAIRESRM